MNPETRKLNLFCSVLTNVAPSSNCRGESEENRTIVQKVTLANGDEHAVQTPESIRNALREMLGQKGLPMNRRRLHHEEQLAVEFEAFPDASKYADDFLFGFMVADKDAIKKNAGRASKRPSVLRMNLAVALVPYRHDTTFHQSPLNAGKSPWQNAPTSALLHREVTVTAFQYPLALHLGDCAEGEGPRWTAALLDALGELHSVAGGHARTLYDMAPRSLVARLTPRLAPGYSSYGFQPDGTFPELQRLLGDDLPAREFFLGGELVRAMPPEQQDALRGRGATLDVNPQRILARLAARVLE